MGSTDGTTQDDSNWQSELERKISRQAVDEGHDADIPSGQGYIVTSPGGIRRTLSVASRRRQSSSRTRDIEKEGADDARMPSNDAGDDDGDDDDTNVVGWNGDDDPEHPYNWPAWKTLAHCGLISAMTFVSPLASSMFAPGVPQLMQEFQSNSLEIAAFVVSVYILGSAAGPLVIAPLSEVYGRNIVYHCCNLAFVAFAIGCALAPNMNALIVFRFFDGVFGSCPVTIGGGSIADMIPQEKRAAAMAAFSVGPLLGPIVGPIAGGFLASAKGWRWVFWVIAIASGVIALSMLVIMKETYHPILLERRAAKLRKETGNEQLRSKLDAGLSPVEYFKRGIVRPMKLLSLSPISIIMSLYMAVAYGYLYLMFTSITEVFMQYYGFSTSIVGLSYIGLGVGSLIGTALFSGTSDKYMKRKAAEADAAAEATDGVKEGMKPEYRLPLLPLGAFLVPIGLFIYGWTADYHVHWIAPIIGMAVVGVGNMIIFMAIQMYVIDAFDIYAASALAANTVVRSIAGAVLPLGGLKMYNKLGVGWGNSLLGFIAFAFVPVTFYILKYGEYLRKRYEIKNL